MILYIYHDIIYGACTHARVEKRARTATLAGLGSKSREIVKDMQAVTIEAITIEAITIEAITIEAISIEAIGIEAITISAIPIEAITI